jgi:hypothetical protein
LEEDDSLRYCIGNVEVENRGGDDGVKGCCACEVEESVEADEYDGCDCSADKEVEFTIDLGEVF